MTVDFPFLPDHSSLHEIRYQKAAAMREAGLNPYPATCQASHGAKQILTDCEGLIASGEEVSLFGRAMSIRRFGKGAFFHLQDESGQVQVHLSKDALTESEFDASREFFDMGDLVGIRGPVFRTKTNEVTVAAKSFAILAKSTRPLPEKWHGLTDKETRYRQRYVDLIVNHDVVDVFRTRSRIVSGMRRWLDAQDFLEVETPMMQPLYGGASARPFRTHHNALGMPLYLRIAPELYLKRLVVGGLHRIFEINRNFRNEGISPQHNPEFSMLELYAAGWDCARMIDFVEELLAATLREGVGSTKVTLADGTECDLAARPWPRITILEALQRFAGIDAHWSMSVADVRRAAPNHTIADEVSSGVDAIIHLFEEHVEHHLVAPTFITEFPKAVSPLAKSKDNDPEVADRFELYINRMELANGFSELNDPREQYARFAEQVERRRRGDQEAVGEIDEDYVRALEYGMPPTAGLGVGMDRFVMVATGATSIRDVILFPLMRPDKGAADSPEPGGEAAT